MKDLKLFSANDNQLASMIKIINKFNDGIGMSFVIDKCKMLIDREIRKMLQQYHTMHSQSDVTQLYTSRKTGGKGLINITNHYKNTIINFSSYLLNSEEQFLKLTSNWQVIRGEKSIHQKAQRYCNEIGHDIQ